MNDAENPYAAPAHGIDHHMIGEPSNDDLIYLGFWKRVVASIVDNILMTIACLPLLFLTKGVIEGKEAQDLTYNLVSFGVSVAAVLLFWQFKQSTPGKMIFSARIVDARTGGKPSFGKLVLRYIGYIPSTLALCLGFLWVAFDKQKRAWHDLMAGTLVVAPRPLADRRRTPRKPVTAAPPAQSVE